MKVHLLLRKLLWHYLCIWWESSLTLVTKSAATLLGSIAVSSSRIWKPPNVGCLKVNTDVAFSNDKIGIRLIVRNYQGISLLVKVIPRCGCYTIDYGELLESMERYTESFSLFGKIIVESDLLTVSPVSDIIFMISRLLAPWPLIFSIA